MTPQDAYNSSIPLMDALDKYGNWRKFNSQPYSQSYPVSENAENQEKATERLIHGFAKISTTITEHNRRINAVKADFKRQLATEKLLGFGYLTPRELGDDPKEIPADIWQLGEIDFSKSEIQSGSLKFESVRIIKRSRNSTIKTHKTALAKKPPNIQPPRPAGRPSSRDKIEAAYQKLKLKGEIDFSKPMTHAYPIIHASLLKMHGTEKGFQNEVIRLVIRDDFQMTAEQIKSARKL